MKHCFEISKLCLNICDFKNERNTASQYLHHLKRMCRVPFLGCFETNINEFLCKIAVAEIWKSNIAHVIMGCNKNL